MPLLAVDGVMLGLIRQMDVANRRANRVMPENSLRLGELDARLDEVRDIGVAPMPSPEQCRVRAFGLSGQTGWRRSTRHGSILLPGRYVPMECLGLHCGAQEGNRTPTPCGGRT